MSKIGDKIFSDADIKKLIDIMTELDDSTRKVLLDGIGRKLTDAGKKDIISKITNLIQTADPKLKEWIAQAIPNSYIVGVTTADEQLNKKTADITVDDLKTLKDLSVHAEAVNGLMSDAYLDFASAMNGMVKGANQKINMATKLQARAKIADNILTGSAIKQTKKDIVEILGDKGFSVLIDRGGNSWTLTRYSEMLARTHTIRAFNDAAINRAVEFGVDLVQISSHSGSCAVCAALEGNVYSLSGDNSQYPRYSIGLPIHPNCTHNLLMRPDLQMPEDYP